MELHVGCVAAVMRDSADPRRSSLPAAHMGMSSHVFIIWKPMEPGPSTRKSSRYSGPLPLLRIEEPPSACDTGCVSGPSPCPPLRLSISSLALSSLALPSVRCEHLHLLHICCSTPICRSIYGITCLQTYTYYVQNSAKDSTLLKTFVRACLAFVLLQFSPLMISGCVLVVSLDEAPLPSPTTNIG
jgi:hypothetical protein